MKLVICVVHSRDKGKISDLLIDSGHKFTVLGSTGGFLGEGNATFMIGVEEDDIPNVTGIISSNCSKREQVVNVMPYEAGPPNAFVANPVKVPVGGAVVFVVDVEQFFRF
jgi:uncharacterized protein YaaQ